MLEATTIGRGDLYPRSVAICRPHGVDVGIDPGINALDEVHDQRIGQTLFLILGHKGHPIEPDDSKAVIQIHLSSGHPLRLVLPSAVRKGHRAYTDLKFRHRIGRQLMLGQKRGKRIQRRVNTSYACVRLIAHLAGFPNGAQAL